MDGQQRLQAALEHMTEAQARMDDSLKELAQERAQTQCVVRDLARQIEDLFGGGLEESAYIVLHDVLGREFGWQVGLLERSWQKWNGEAVELDIFGQAQDPIAHLSCLRPVPSFCSAGLRARPHQARRPGSTKKEDARK